MKKLFCILGLVLGLFAAGYTVEFKGFEVFLNEDGKEAINRLIKNGWAMRTIYNGSAIVCTHDNYFILGREIDDIMFMLDKDAKVSFVHITYKSDNNSTSSAFYQSIAFEKLYNLSLAKIDIQTQEGYDNILNYIIFYQNDKIYLRNQITDMQDGSYIYSFSYGSRDFFEFSNIN